MARRKTVPPPAPAAATTAAAPQDAAKRPPVAPADLPDEPAPGAPGPGRAPRRRFVLRLWALLGAAVFGESAWVTWSFLRPRQRDATSASLFVAGPLERFEPGSVTAFPSGRFYLVRLKDGGLLALHRECTHLGCTVPWDATLGRFACPCHASSFDITGQVLSAPAPRPLDLYAVRVENGIVKVDTGRRQQRTAFDPSQVTVG